MDKNRIIPWEETRRGITRLDEVSINRILQHGKHGFVVISANRSEIYSANPELDLTSEYEEYIKNFHLSNTKTTQDMWLKKRNAKADKDLLDDIRKTHFSYTPSFGGYHGTDNVKDSYEPSYIVYCHGRGGDY